MYCSIIKWSANNFGFQIIKKANVGVILPIFLVTLSCTVEYISGWYHIIETILSSRHLTFSIYKGKIISVHTQTKSVMQLAKSNSTVNSDAATTETSVIILCKHMEINKSFN